MKIPLYATGTENTKYVNNFTKPIDIDRYYTNQQDEGGLFGLFGVPFHRIFEEHNSATVNYYFPLLVSYDNILEIADAFDIPDNVLDDIANHKCKILMVCPFEGFDWNFWEKLASIVGQQYNLTYENFVVMDGNLTEHDVIKSVYFNYWERNMMYRNLSDFETTGTTNIIEKHWRHNKFIFLNRRPHHGRQAAVTLMHDHFDKGLISLHLNGQMHPGYYEAQERLFKDRYPTIFNTYTQIDLKSRLPMTINDGIDAEQANPVNDTNVYKFYDAFLHIVAETYQSPVPGDRMFFSEKIFKPVMTMQPFVLLGQQHSLRAFKELGYQTFDKFIDESYDDIENDEQRLEAAIASATEFFDRSNDELHDVMIEMLPVLNHNISYLQFRCMTNDNKINTALNAALEY
jgi:hypothetical protein